MWTHREASLGKLDPGLRPGSVAVSPDSNHLAYVAARQEPAVIKPWDDFERDIIPKWNALLHGRSILVRDGAEERPVGDIDPASLRFSPDGGRLAYVTQIKEAWAVVADGGAGPRFAEVRAAGVTFSPDGKRLAYAARDDDGWHVVVDD